MEGYKRTTDTLNIRRGYIEFEYTLEDKSGFAHVPNKSVRGKITKFTRKSQTRMLKKILEKTESPQLWIDQTFPDEFFEFLTDDEIAEKTYNHIKIVHQKYINHYKYGCIWKREWKPRLSGKHKGRLLPHFHLLIYGVPKAKAETVFAFINTYHVKFMKLSPEATNKAMKVAINRKSWRIIENSNHAVFYVTKYVAKPAEYDTAQSLGRMWGQIGDIKATPPMKYRLTPTQSIKLRRLLKKKLGKTYYKKVKKKINGGSGFYLIQNILTTFKMLGLSQGGEEYVSANDW